MNKYALAGFCVMALSVTTGAWAAQDPTMVKSVGLKSSWFFGLGIGRTRASIPSDTVDGLNSQLTAANAASFSVVDKDSDGTGVKASLGYSFNRYFALEGGYAYLGKSKANMDFRTGLNSVGFFNLTYSMWAVFLDGVGTLPLGDKWELLGRVGLSYNRVHAGFDGFPLTLAVGNKEQNEGKVNLKFGAGVAYNFTPDVAMRAEWEHYKMPDPFSDEKFNEDMASLSLVFKF